MDYTNYAAHSQPYQFFVPNKPEPQFTTQEDSTYNPLHAFSHPSSFPAFFDQHAQYPPPSIIPPVPTQSPPQHSLQRPNGSHVLPPDNTAPLPTDMSTEVEYDQAQGRSSDDERESLTPAQSRRKAQNRAAQRAFRERKERHVKDLELKLKSMEARSTEIMSDNERLKRELDRVATQNEILRATSGSNSQNRSSSSHSRQLQQYQVESPGGVGEDPDGNLLAAEDHSMVPAPITYSPRTFNAAFSSDHATKIATTTLEPDGPTSHRVAINNLTGERLLSTGAAWEYIQQSELFQQGAIDLGEVVDRLRERVICDGAGPSFAESEVRKAMEESVGAVGDELI